MLVFKIVDRFGVHKSSRNGRTIWGSLQAATEAAKFLWGRHSIEAYECKLMKVYEPYGKNSYKVLKRPKITDVAEVLEVPKDDAE